MEYDFVIYNLRTLRLYKGNSYGPKHYEEERIAKAQFTKLTRGLKPKLVAADWKVIPFEDYRKLDTKITVRNLLSGSECQIDVNDEGGCCDPSTERYHCM